MLCRARASGARHQTGLCGPGLHAKAQHKTGAWLQPGGNPQPSCWLRAALVVPWQRASLAGQGQPALSAGGAQPPAAAGVSQAPPLQAGRALRAVGVARQSWGSGAVVRRAPGCIGEARMGAGKGKALGELLSKQGSNPLLP